MTTKTVECLATYESIRSADDTLRRLLADEQVSNELAASCELALHELLTNLVDHAYQGNPSGMIQITITVEQDVLTCQTIDTGKGNDLDLSAISMPDPSELAESGYGLGLITLLVDAVEYQNKNGQNVWTIRKKLV